MLVESERSDRRQLQSFPTRGGVAYVARGNGNVECLIVEKGTVRAVTTDERSLPGLVNELRVGAPAATQAQSSDAPTTRAEALAVDATVAEAREALAPGATPGQVEGAVQSLHRVLAGGLDQGATAGLRDLSATFPSVAATGLPRGNRPYRAGFSYCSDSDAIELRGTPVGYQSFSSEESGDPQWNDLSGPSLHVYNLGSLSLPIMFRPGRMKKLLVCFSGAQDRAKVSLPRLEWQRQFEDVDCAQLFVSDPTLDLAPDIRIGWYLGSPELDLPKVLSTIIQKYMAGLEIEEVWLMGTSGGGFAALQTSALIAHSNSFAVNPQTDVTKYRARFARKACAHVFGEPDPGRTARTVVAERLKEAQLPVSMRIMLNVGDLHHRRDHVLPLAAEVSEFPAASLEVHEVDWGPGHVSKVPVIVKAVKAALDATT